MGPTSRVLSCFRYTNKSSPASQSYGSRLQPVNTCGTIATRPTEQRKQNTSHHSSHSARFSCRTLSKSIAQPRVASSHDSLHTSRKQQPSMNTSLTAVKYCPRRPASVRNDSGDRHAVGAISLVYTGSRSQEQSARSRQQRRYRCGVRYHHDKKGNGGVHIDSSLTKTQKITTKHNEQQRTKVIII